MLRKDISKKELALKIGKSVKTIYNRFENGDFKMSEIEKIVDILEIENPEKIFFSKKVYQK